ncbi:MAG: FkbM family methyltransferase [Akkermansiaceae bacterium]|jgi:FkbM family methyltransferase
MKNCHEYLQCGLNRLLSILPNSDRKSVSFNESGGIFEIYVEGKVISAPGIRRWRQYRKGIDARLLSVARRYGLHDLTPSKEGEWVVDVGGYMGEWSLYMLRKGFNVLVIEPDPNAAKCLKENLTRLAPEGRKWLHDPRVALNECKEVTFYSEPTNADGSVFSSPNNKSKAITLQAQRLDDIVADRIGDQPIRALKMDAEGAEPEVLMGATKVISSCSNIGIDAGPERMGKSTSSECRKVLQDAGFSFPLGNEISGMVVASKI